MKKQKGINIIEFAIVSLLFFTLLFGIIEFARLMFIINTLGEASRRGARIAAVCPIDSSTTTQIRKAIRFSSDPKSKDDGNILDINDIDIIYLDSSFNPVFTNPITSAPDAKYESIEFVQVSIGIGEQKLAIPASIQKVFPPSVTTTLPRESLGRTTTTNPTTRQCF